MFSIDIKKKPKTKKVFLVFHIWPDQEFKSWRELNVQEVDKFILNFKAYLKQTNSTVTNMNLFATCEFEEVRNVAEYIILKML